MEKENEIQNNEEKETPNGTDQTENKTAQPKGDENQPDGGDEKEEISKAELATLRKKASDFDSSVILKKLSKLDKKQSEAELDSPGVDKNEDDRIAALTNEIEGLKQTINSGVVEKRNQALESAYKEFISEHKWADNDEHFEKISQKSNLGGLLTKEEMLSHLKSVALSLYPSEYEKATINKAKSQILAEQQTLNAGAGGGGTAENKFAKGGQSEEDKIALSFMRNFPPGFKISEKYKK